MSERTEILLADGVRLYAEVTGPADAPVTVVLLHGWCLDRRTWRHQVSALCGQDGGAGGLGRRAPRVIAYDTRGHGRSSATRRHAATLDQLGDDLAEVLRRLAPSGPVVLAGHSMGGMTIMEYAHRHPDEFASRVAGLLLVSTTAEGHTHTRYGLPPTLAGVLRAGETLGAGLLARSGAWRPHRAVLPALAPALRWLLFGDRCAEDDLGLTLRSVGRASLRSIGGFRTSIGAQQRLDTLATVGEVPAAVLVGDRDRLTPPACAESIAGALPCAELTVCPGAGHMLPLERPDEVSAALLTIVRRVNRSTRKAQRPAHLRKAA
ncbi:pimeloyl-ACP methyl ester carboxylesterase [Actinoplanes octamycinicus]|uniref:Pimeloyl-ACP methyl ester carboxylesterase n=1 Tax=Actinoplanes octamycinicus TaxID=135948 RepID=A0A7W7M797_9ACTN|nr:alpha/beta hydrolase [Actinoplanes octamycinicus]MBB4739578.1 pimeloyl-ACP methyl ester carboxylesterase [Actinoplanes octamycinicus]GIE54759.1 alpha/beta hydrolase [Actinoplanes octamycinicus]